ncbi:MAG: hypothetical protein CME81_03760 [Halomonas sp.]|nr:hypothetical protein [Halomonas sp.]
MGMPTTRPESFSGFRSYTVWRIISILLTLLGYIPGIVHAVYIIAKK